VNKILDLIFGKFPDWLNRCAARMEQKPVKQKAKPVDQVNEQGLTYQELKDRVKIRGTNVTAPGIYMQDWDRDETAEDRVARLKRLAMQSTKVNRRTK